MSSVRFFSPGVWYAAHKEEMDNAMQDVLLRGQLILRKEVEDFEKKLAAYVGTKFALGVANGTDALYITLLNLGIGAGDEVICPSYTFRATVEAIHFTGATPVLTDLGEDWRLYKTDKTKAIIPAHIAGEHLDWTPDEGIIMVEDACQAIGVAPIKGIAACYSFYPAKLLGCYGDGGGIATNDEALYLKLKAFRNHHKEEYTEEYGWNSRLDNLQAAVLNVKIKYLPEAIKRRKEIAESYDGALPQEIIRPSKREAYQDYIVEFRTAKERDDVYEQLKAKGIETMKNGYDFPKATPKKPKTLDYEARSLRLPCNETLTFNDVLTVIDALEEIYDQAE